MLLFPYYYKNNLFSSTVDDCRWETIFSIGKWEILTKSQNWGVTVYYSVSLPKKVYFSCQKLRIPKFTSIVQLCFVCLWKIEIWPKVILNFRKLGNIIKNSRLSRDRAWWSVSLPEKGNFENSYKILHENGYINAFWCCEVSLGCFTFFLVS